MRQSRLACAAFVLMAILGSGAPAAAQSIDLAWDASTETDLAGYRVYVGLTPGSYSQSFDLTPTATSFSFVNPAPNTRYYFVVTAFNSGGEESPYSNEVNAVLGGDSTPPVLTITSPAGAVTVDTPQIALAGTASDNVDLMPVTWSNSRGGSGTATGTASWSVSSVPLLSGTNVITVTARDGGNNTTQATVTVTYEIPPLTTPVLVSPSGSSSTNRPTFVWNAQPAATHYQLWVNDSTGNGRISTIYTTAQVNCASGVGTCSVRASVDLTGTVQWWVAARNSTGESPWSAPLTFTIGSSSDTTAPNITIGSPAGAVTVTTGTIAVSGTASDNVGVTQVTWANDRGGSGTASGTTSWSVAGVPLQSGANVIRVTARDAANNTRSASVTVTYNVPDTTAPTISIASPGNVAVTTGTVTVSGSASDNVGVTQVTWANDRGGSGTASGTTSWSASVGLQSGQNVIVVTARDAANNTRSASITVTYNPPDTTAPSLTITSPGSVTVTTGTVAVTGTASDNAGVTQVTWVNDRGGSGTAAGTTSWVIGSVTLQSGQNVITVTARDGANNARSASITVTYNLTLPAAPVLIGPGGSSSTATPTFTWNAVGGATGYQLWVNDSSGNARINMIYSASQTGCGSGSGTCAIAPGTILTGTVQWWVLARNAAGTGPWSAPLSFTVGSSSDTTPPTVTITSPGNVTVTTGGVAVSGTASDNVGVTQVTWANDRGGSGTASGTSSWSVSSVPLQSGQNVITVTARDAANNRRQAQVTVTYNSPDTTPPSIAILVPGVSGNVSSGILPMSGTAGDDVGVTRVTWANDRGGNGTASGTTSWSVSGVPLQSGLNVITVTAHDAANNTRSASVTMTYETTDTTPPSISITTPSGPTTVTVPAASLGGTASDNVGVTQVTWANDRGGSGTASGTTSWATSVGLQSGTNVITVTARDASNNTRSASVTITYGTTTVPARPVLISPSGSSSTRTPTYTWNASAGATSYQLWVNDSLGNGRINTIYTATQTGCGGGTGTCAITPTVAVSGSAQWWVLARNSAGQSPWSAPLSFAVGTSADTTAPSLAIASPANGTTFTNPSIAVSGTASDNVGVTQVTWANDRGGSGTASGTTSWSASSVPLQTGTNVIMITARDAANNTRQASLTVTYSAGGSAPAAPVLVSPSGSQSTYTPSFVWNAVSNATHYQLWVNDGSGNGRIQAIYTASQVNCSSGSGTCSVNPGVALTGSGQWWVAARNAVGESPWSNPLSFTIAGTGSLVAPTLLLPSGTGSSRPTFSWTAVPSATNYLLWVNDAYGNGRVQLNVTASQANCAGGGTCTATPTVTLAGTATWWVQSRIGTQGPWSAPLTFQVR